MASTNNTNINNTSSLTSDIYQINNYVNEIKKKFTPNVNEDTLMLGIFGYTGQLFSDLLQNSIVMASEFSNESIPTKAKFEKNIIAHALGLGITDINAVPSQFDVLLTFVEDDIIKWGANSKGEYTFTFDKDTPIYIGDYCFHTDYDIIIKKIKLDGGEDKYAYTAMYDIDIDNPISEITNPYLTPPVSMKVNGANIIFTQCTLHQVVKTKLYKKVLGDNSISAKTFTFEFEGQLASFTIDVKEGNKKSIHLVPVYEGLSTPIGKYPYFYYSYLDSNTIRVKFDRSSYSPRTNSEVTINIQTTSGEAGNFTFNPEVYPYFSFESDKYGYSNIGCEIRPVTGEAAFGTDKKSIEDLQKLIPKEAIARGSITNLTDVENFFNAINTDDSKVYIYKKRDNALERLYYSFILMKDSFNNIIPTNTITIRIFDNELPTEQDSEKLIFKKGQTLRLVDNDYAVICENSLIEGDIVDEDGKKCDCDCAACVCPSPVSSEFKYVIPYNFVINRKPLYGMYYLTVIDAKKFLDFSYINDKCLYQYISTSISVNRPYIENNDTYEISIAAAQNIASDKDNPMIIYDDEGNISKVNLKCVAVFYDEEDNPYRWSEASLSNYNTEANIFYFKFTFKTNDLIDVKNRIRLEKDHLYDPNSMNESVAHFGSNMKCVIHFLSLQNEGDTGWNGLEKILPESFLYDDYSETTGEDGNPVITKSNPYKLSNSYTVVDGVDFFYDYSDIVSSIVTPIYNKDSEFLYYEVKGVPVVKYDYFDTEDKAIYFCNELVKGKNYIDYAIQILEDAFGMDFKFFNTYGPSKLFTIPNYMNETGYEYLNKTNLNLTFRLKLKPNYDTNIINDILADIKAYVENINEIDSLHMPNLISEITGKYGESLIFFEFVDVNGYGPGIQHIEAKDMPDEVITPEFLNIQTYKDAETKEVKPDITLIMA